MSAPKKAQGSEIMIDFNKKVLS